MFAMNNAPTPDATALAEMVATQSGNYARAVRAGLKHDRGEVAAMISTLKQLAQILDEDRAANA